MWIQQKTALLLMFFSALASFSQAEERPVFYTLEWLTKKVQIPFYLVEGMHMNDVCKANLAICAASMAAKKAPNVPEAKEWKKFSSPAAAYCKELAGHPMRMSDSEKNEVSICTFKDRSMIDSWHLYSKRKQK